MTRIFAKKRISKHYLFHFFPGPLRNRIPIPEVLMPFTVVLAVGLDSSLVSGLKSAWQYGHFVTPVKSIREATIQVREGDFDPVILGHSIPTDSRERFTLLIRASGSRTPVVSITDSSTECDCFGDATIRNNPVSMLKSIRELMEERAGAPVPSRNMPAIAA